MANHKIDPRENIEAIFEKGSPVVYLTEITTSSPERGWETILELRVATYLGPYSERPEEDALVKEKNNAQGVVSYRNILPIPIADALESVLMAGPYELAAKISSHVMNTFPYAQLPDYKIELRIQNIDYLIKGR